MKGERKRCLDFEQLLAARSFRSIRHFGRVGNGWKRYEKVTIHFNPFNFPIPCTCSVPYKDPQRIWWNDMLSRVGRCALLALSLCTLCLRSKLQEKIEWQKFVSCTSRPHVMCGPLAVKVATCSRHHHLSCRISLSFLLLTIQGKLHLLPLILLKIDPSCNVWSISPHSPSKKPCYFLNGKIYPPESWSEPAEVWKWDHHLRFHGAFGPYCTRKSVWTK